MRSPQAARAVAAAAAAAAELRLLGVACFEGVLRSQEAAPELVRVEALLDRVEAVLDALVADGAPEAEELLVSAGGSAFFDAVLARFGGAAFRGRPLALVLRSGAYVTHDGGLYERLSPLAGRRPDGDGPRLRDAIEVWSVVLSRPEPEVAIVSMGKRDAPLDVALPQPLLAARRGDRAPRPLRARTTALSDQHGHLALDAEEPLAVGDLVCCTVSHPCTALDRWRLIPLVDDRYDVVGAVHTFF